MYLYLGGGIFYFWKQFIWIQWYACEFYKVIYNMFLKGYPLEAKTAPKNGNQSVHISWARLASFCHLGVISHK